MDKRIYKVTDNSGLKKEQLVLATSQAQALRHIAGKTYKVEIAKAIDVAEMVRDGVQVENAQ